MDRRLVQRIAGLQRSRCSGRFQRHSSPRVPAFEGSSAGGRWGRTGSFPVLYLGRPEASVVVEAYRHLVDEIEGMRPELVGPRKLHTCDVDVGEVLDLTIAEQRLAAGLTDNDIYSDPDDALYANCQDVAQAAHQLGFHGILAPAATRLGQTLALFPRRLAANEMPVPVGEPITWQGLPPDPRRLRVISSDDAG